MSALKKNSCVVHLILAAMGAVWGLCSYFYMQWTVPLYGATLAIVFAGVFAVLFITERQKMYSVKSAVKRSLIVTAVCCIVYFAVAFIINNVFLKAQHSELTVSILLIPFCVFLCILYTRWKNSFKRLVNKKPVPFGAVLSVILAVIITMLPVVKLSFLPTLYKKHNIKEAVPLTAVSYKKTQYQLVEDAMFYVAPSGDDSNPGTFEEPFATPERAKEAVRDIDKTGLSGITVALKGGEYRVSDISFTSEDGGTESCPVTYCAYGDGEVVFNGGVTLSPDSFAAVSDSEMLERLSEDVRDKVVCVDIKALGITAEQYGKIYAIGNYNTAAKYDGDYIGPLYCELFVNDARMSVARYPDEGWLKTEKVLEVGYGRESDGSLSARENWDEVRNPAPDVYEISDELSARIASWKTLDDVWMFGFWKYDWADASTPIGSFDAEKNILSPEFVSVYGAKEGAPYYFFNVFEELDAPGEWYLDRENGILYLYPPEELENAVIDLSVTTDGIITVDGADNLIFRGLTVKGTRGDAVVITGNNCAVQDCLIKNVAGNAIIINGNDCTVSDNEIMHTGKGGIIISGGDCETLTSGNSVAINNLIHDWSEVYMTYQPAVSLYGCGNFCLHNEIYNSPHEAITYGGNNHDIAYNLIHDVCLLGDDAGAIYSGRSWISYGTSIRYNCIYDLGSGEHAPCGIYLDDALSGQSVYGNILVNVPHIGIQLGGGRDLDVRNNIIINTNLTPFSYDQRAIDGVFGGWFNHSSVQNGDMWQELYNSPWQTEIWQNAFPEMVRFSDNFDDTDSYDFVPNPAYSKVNGNVTVNISGNFGDISEKARKYSDISGNAVFRLKQLDDIFTAPANGDYTVKESSPVFDIIPDFEQLPFEQMGRVN